MSDMLEVVIDSIRVSLMSQQRIVILRELNAERCLSMWIGVYEAEAITLSLQDVEVARPLPGTHQPLSVLVAHNDLENRNAVLITNVPIHSEADALQIYSDWRLRGKIEHGYRFDQEQGLDVEDLRVHTLERMRRLFALVLAAAQFVFYLMRRWPRKAMYWLRKLGGKLGLKTDRDGPYIVFRGIGAVFITAATLSFTAFSPFPHVLFPPR